MSKQNTSSDRPPRFRERATEARRAQARDEILAATRAIVLEKGLSGLTMSALAKRLGVTKPAVYYYFDSRDALIAAAAVRTLEAEADALVAALDEAADPVDAVERFVRACIDHHRAHLDDFRLIYAFGQTVPALPDDPVRERAPPITNRFYDRLEACLAEGQREGRVAAEVHPRRAAVSLHLAAIGFVTMFSVTEAKGDPMKHGFDPLVEELVRTVRRGLGVQR